MPNSLVTALDPLLSLDAYGPQNLAASSERYGKLHALGGPNAVLAAADREGASTDEWSGGFDIHLGVYTRN